MRPPSRGLYGPPVVGFAAPPRARVACVVVPTTAAGKLTTTALLFGAGAVTVTTAGKLTSAVVVRPTISVIPTMKTPSVRKKAPAASASGRRIRRSSAATTRSSRMPQSSHTRRRLESPGGRGDRSLTEIRCPRLQVSPYPSAPPEKHEQPLGPRARRTRRPARAESRHEGRAERPDLARARGDRSRRDQERQAAADHARPALQDRLTRDAATRVRAQRPRGRGARTAGRPSRPASSRARGS